MRQSGISASDERLKGGQMDKGVTIETKENNLSSWAGVMIVGAGCAIGITVAIAFWSVAMPLGIGLGIGIAVTGTGEGIRRILQGAGQYQVGKAEVIRARGDAYYKRLAARKEGPVYYIEGKDQ